MDFKMKPQNKKQVYSCREIINVRTQQYKFRTVVSEVSSFVGYSVYLMKH